MGYRDTLPLATKFKYELTSSVSLGIEVDTVDSKKWNPPHLPSARTHQHARLPPMHPDDAALLEWYVGKEVGGWVGGLSVIARDV